MIRRILARVLAGLSLAAVGACATQAEVVRLQQEVIDLQRQLAFEKKRQAEAVERRRQAEKAGASR